MKIIVLLFASLLSGCSAKYIIVPSTLKEANDICLSRGGISALFIGPHDRVTCMDGYSQWLKEA